MTTNILTVPWSVAPVFREAPSRDRDQESTVDSRGRITTWRALRPVAQVYIGSVILCGGLAIGYSVPHVARHDAWLFATLAILSLIMSIAKVNLPVPRSVSTLTICYVLDFTTLLLLGPAAATLVAALGAWSQCTFRRRHRAPAFQMWFSVGTLALTVQAAGWIYSSLGGRPGLPAAGFHVEALIAAATVFFVANSALVASAVGISTRQSAVRVWVATYLWSWPGHLLGFCLAVGAAAGIEQSGFWLLPLALVSLALTYENFKAYVGRFAESLTDPLTELPNRRYLLTHVAQEIARSERNDSPLAMMVIDLNGFKSINDKYGHAAGDAALRGVAQCLQQSIRAYDTCARYGGDEFIAVLPGCGVEDAQSKASVLQVAVAALQYQPKAGVIVPLRVSVGIAVFPADGRTFEQLLAVADSGMFQDKGEQASRVATPVRSRAARGRPSKLQKMTKRELRAQLFQSQKMAAIGQLTSGVAHDFNNALTAILGYSDLVTEQMGSDKTISHDLMEIVSAAQHAAALTHQLLAFSRKEDLAMTAVDLNEVVCSAKAILGRLLGEPIVITATLAAGLNRVMANANQLEQVVINLAVNARDAMPKGGVLQIQTHNVELGVGDASLPAGAKAGDYVVLSVSDTGIGMTPEVRSRILEPFFTTKEAGRGTGLGLAMISSAVAQLGGSIRVDSEPERGSTFQIYLPRTHREAERSPAPAPGLTVALPMGGETILLVEDEAGVRDFVKLALRRHGYRVIEAHTAEAALTMLDGLESPIDLLLTDVVLPGIDGRELATLVERDRPHMPILYTTGYTERMRDADGHLNMHTLLEKPFTARALLTKTRELLDERNVA